MSACDTVEQQQEGERKSGKVKRKKVKGECKIHILNDDCLMHIFSYLTKRERFRIERVCKRWKAVCLDMWLYQKHLDFTSVFPSSSETLPFPSSSESYLDMPILEAFLKRCGRNLQSLHLANRPHRLNISVHKIIATYCKNLRCLHLGGLPVTTFGFRFLLTISQELRVLNLDCCLGVFDKDLRRMFRGCQHLESVTLSRNKNVTGKCLRFLAHAPLKELVLYECNSIHPGNLVSVLRELKSLTSLSLSSCDRVSLRDVPVIIGAAPKLQSLSLTESFSFNSTVVEALGQLHDLISLDLQQNYAVNDQIMDAITRSCLKIEKLNITGCNERIRNTGYVTDSGLRSLAALPNLFDLSMSYFPSLSDKALEAVASKGKLRKLVCRGCQTFTDVACISVVTSCNELELFDFSGCDHVTDATVRVALDSVKLRTNSVKLTLVVGGTRVSKYSAVKKNPLLEVDFSDLRTYRCRPRFVFDHCFPPPLIEDFRYRDVWDDDDAENYFDSDFYLYNFDSDSYLYNFAHKE
ncbi:F-box/LRR-repeat protein 2 [Zootermopsis nevadensis]|uniref:F-box/LRR-repeat protein 2 n=2 Tax=Zootermopsis nevadensis TaxID=136037 RepID=A0A067RTK7_ZOONE|nr:F-box/LRR-repeat protein 2 [Zootermopsis nevadensis]